METGPTTKPLRLLIVEDSGDDAYLLLRELRKGGYEPEYLRVDTLSAVTDVLVPNRWDLLISDYKLPRFTALDVLAIARDRTPEVPAIVISGAVGEDLAVETMRAGAHDYIMKDRLTRLCPAIQRELAEAEGRLARRTAEKALRESEARFRELTESIHEAFWMIDCEQRCMTYVSPAFEKIWQRSSAPLKERVAALLDTVHPEDFDRVRGVIACGDWEKFQLEYRIQRPDGSERWVHTRSFPIREEGERVRRVSGITVDITERKRLELEAQKLTRALEQTGDAVMILDREGHIEYVNTTFEDMSGYTRAEVLGKTPRLLRSGYQDEAFYTQVWRTLRNGLPFTDVFVSRRKDGELFYEEKTVAPVRDARGDITHFVSTGRDVTRRLRMQQSLNGSAGKEAAAATLANRIAFVEKLQQAVLKGKRLGRSVGVLCIGIETAELLGGNGALEETLLGEIAERLRKVSDPNDVIARLERGEFALLRREGADPEALEQLARAILDAFTAPVSAHGYELYLSPNVGISLCPRDSELTDELLANAGSAMRDSRAQRSRGFRFFSQGNGARPTTHLSS